MSFDISDKLFEGLRSTLLAERERNAVCDEHDAVWLHTDMGVTFYLERNGTVLKEESITTPGIVEPASPAESIMAILLAARHYRSESLYELLPKREDDSTDCSECGGTGLRRLSGTLQFFCPLCAGLGWVEGRVSEGGSNVG